MSLFKNQRNQWSRSAFTLIELLVVIAIIGLLATLSVIALNNARAKSRDAKRLADIKQTHTALELYYNSAGHYPTAAEFQSGQLAYNSGSGTTTYMQVVPQAPTPADGSCDNANNSYSYTQIDGGASYTLTFCVAQANPDLGGGNLVAWPGGISRGTGGTSDNGGGGTTNCPYTIQTAASNELNCTMTYATLSASSQAAFNDSVSYLWTGPNGFVSTQSNPMLSQSGAYHLTITDSDNNCTATSNVNIISNFQIPSLNLSADNNGTLTCSVSVVTITANSTASVTYLWPENAFPGGTEQEALVIAPGDYPVTATDNANGCTNSKTITIGQDVASAACNIINPGSPTASVNNTITAQAITGGNYSWSILPSPGWSIASGANTSALTFHAGASGTSATIKLSTQTSNGCVPTNCQIVLTAL